MLGNLKAKVLIADDSPSQLTALEQILVGQGLEVVCAEHGLDAVELFQQQHPDLVILDVLMPKMEGIEAAKIMRQTQQEIYVPIIFITGADSMENLQRCIAAGGDDFIAKPINPALLCIKLCSLLRIRRLHQDQLEQKKQLLEYQHIIEQEQEAAASIYKKVIQTDFLETPQIRFFLSPMALFNGDILLTAKSPGNQLYVFLGDFTGHGLTASIGAGPTAEMFYGMTRKGFGISEIISEINRKLHKLLPVNVFLAATLLACDHSSGNLKLITCGLPDHYLLDRETGGIKTVTSQNLPLGVLASYTPEIQFLKVHKQHYLYMFSDGVIESENSAGEQFKSAGVENCLRQQPASGFDAIKAALDKHCQGLGQQDDITLVELHCDLEEIASQQDEGIISSGELISLPWKSSMEFHVRTLQHIDPIPVLVNSLMEIQGLQRHRETIFLIVNELFNNAVEHGLLKLKVSKKEKTEDFSNYQHRRAEQFKHLQEGFVRVSFNHQPLTNGGRLVIRVQDSGEGFDVAKVTTGQTILTGGINRVKKLCKTVEFMEGGSRVKAIFDWFITETGQIQN